MRQSWTSPTLKHRMHWNASSVNYNLKYTTIIAIATKTAAILKMITKELAPRLKPLSCSRSERLVLFAVLFVALVVVFVVFKASSVESVSSSCYLLWAGSFQTDGHQLLLYMKHTGTAIQKLHFRPKNYCSKK